MKAIVQTGYDSPDAFELREVDIPTLKENAVLVRVHAAALHAGDVFMMRGVPYFTRFVVGFPKPRGYIPGYDAAGRVEAIGNAVKRFRVGDEVFGSFAHTCAELALATQTRLEHKPGNLTFEQAAAVATSGTAALVGLRDAGRVQPGQHVLINGASGGVGTFAVQIAKAFGAEVTGVCSTRNVELVRSIGADHVIDYTREDFTQGAARYDLILDNVANHRLSDCRRVLTPDGKHIPNSGNVGMGYILKALLVSLFVRQQGRTYVATPKPGDLLQLKELIEAEEVKPVIDRAFALSQTAEAFAYLNEGHAREGRHHNGARVDGNGRLEHHKRRLVSMSADGKVNTRGGWAIGGTTLMGLGVGFIFLQTSALYFVASLLVGIGLGVLIAALIPSQQG